MIDYDTEATRYDDTRGGAARAEAAARAVGELLPDDARLVLDMAGGTGIVGARLTGRTVCSVDRSRGMSRLAATRLPGRVAVGDAARLPIAAGSVDAVTAVWLLHLLSADTVPLVIAEVARVLRPGGMFVTTTNKSQAHATTPDDVGACLGPSWPLTHDTPSDDLDRVTELAARHALQPVGRTTFVGVGLGLSPRGWANRLGHKAPPWLAELPDQDRPRADPEFRLVAFRLGRSPCPAA